MKTIKSCCFLLLVLIGVACQQEAQLPMDNTQFFDLKAFFEKEQKQLTSINRIIKKATVDGKVEEKTVNSINFEEELALFVDSDINKISWLDKYTVDSTFTNQVLSSISYQAKDEKLKTNLLAIQFEQDKVSHIKIIRKTSSIAAQLEQELTYTPLKGYTINSRQKTSLTDPHVLALDVQFIQ